MKYTDTQTQPLVIILLVLHTRLCVIPFSTKRARIHPSSRTPSPRPAPHENEPQPHNENEPQPYDEDAHEDELRPHEDTTCYPETASPPPLISIMQKERAVHPPPPMDFATWLGHRAYDNGAHAQYETNFYPKTTSPPPATSIRRKKRVINPPSRHIQTQSFNVRQKSLRSTADASRRHRSPSCCGFCLRYPSSPHPNGSAR